METAVDRDNIRYVWADNETFPELLHYIYINGILDSGHSSSGVV